MTIDIEAIYENTIDGIRDNARVNSLAPGENWSPEDAWAAIDCYNPDLDTEALTVGQTDDLLRRVTTYLTPTRQPIASAGYIVHDENGTIHGTGGSNEAAWDDMLRTMQTAGIRLLRDGDESGDELGNWTYESGLTTRQASAALLRAVEDMGGDLAWDEVGGVAVTRDEAEG